jgi:hypothetical protein
MRSHLALPSFYVSFSRKRDFVRLCCRGHFLLLHLTRFFFLAACGPEPNLQLQEDGEDLHIRVRICFSQMHSS